MSSVFVTVDIQDVDANCVIEATPEIHHILVVLVNLTSQAIVMHVVHIERMRMESVNVKNMSPDHDVINVHRHHST